MMEINLWYLGIKYFSEFISYEIKIKKDNFHYLFNKNWYLIKIENPNQIRHIKTKQLKLICRI